MKLACIDIGLKRIGIAICLNLDIVTPLQAIIRKNRNQASNELSIILKDWEIDILVVGFPSASLEMQKRIKHFIKLIKFSGTIVFQEENMSSVEAKELIKGTFKYKKDGRIDSLAAKIILERYLL